MSQIIGKFTPNLSLITGNQDDDVWQIVSIKVPRIADNWAGRRCICGDNVVNSTYGVRPTLWVQY